MLKYNKLSHCELCENTNVKYYKVIKMKLCKNCWNNNFPWVKK